MGTTRKAEQAAETCGMSIEQWSETKKQAHSALTRGRRAQAQKKLDTWGDVDGQDTLFDVDDEGE